jgi:acyl transferase domain-containing protein
MAKGSFLSPDAHCKAFDESANGYARAGGAGIVVVKPLAAAMRDGDPIYAVIRGIGVNQDGRTNGITVPNGDAQAQLIQQVYRESGISFDDVSYIEAHGTGTAVGDPTEVKAFATVLTENRSVPTPCRFCQISGQLAESATSG